MWGSMRLLIGSTKSRVAQVANFDTELFKSYFDAERDVFAELCELWAWFPADSEMLGWHEKEKSEHFIDRIELVVYILYLREMEELLQTVIKSIEFSVELFEVCQEIKGEIQRKLKETTLSGLKTLLLRR